MSMPPVRGGLDDGGTATGADFLDDAPHDGGGGGDVVAVDAHPADVVSRGPALEGGRVLRRRGRELGVAVVLAPEDHGELPHGGEVHRLVEGALREGTVPEEGDSDTPVGPKPGGGGRTDGDRQAGRDDAVRTENADARVRDMHGATATPVGPGVLAHQLREHAEGCEALSRGSARGPGGSR